MISQLEVNRQYWLKELTGSLALKQEELKVNIVGRKEHFLSGPERDAIITYYFIICLQPQIALAETIEVFAWPQDKVIGTEVVEHIDQRPLVRILTQEFDRCWIGQSGIVNHFPARIITKITKRFAAYRLRRPPGSMVSPRPPAAFSACCRVTRASSQVLFV